MNSDAFGAELEHRLELLEEPDHGGMILPDLPLRDILMCVIGLVSASVLLLVWCL